jgi:hypothetical protein
MLVCSTRATRNQSGPVAVVDSMTSGKKRADFRQLIHCNAAVRVNQSAFNRMFK